MAAADVEGGGSDLPLPWQRARSSHRMLDQPDGARSMNRQIMTIEEAANMLIEVAEHVGLEQFAHVADELLEGNSHDDIALISQYLPLPLRDLLPNRVLH